MKKLIYYLCLMTGIVILATSCNDDDNAPPTPQSLLTKVASDGVPVIELTYDSDRKLRRTNFYVDGELSNYYLYDYSEEGIQELLKYDADHDLVSRSVFTLDNAGRVIKVEDYSAFFDFKSVSSNTTFTYDAAGRENTRSYSTIYEVDFIFHKISYNTNGQPVKHEITTYPNQPEEYKSSEVEFTPGDKPMYPHWSDAVFLLSLSNAQDYVEEMFNIETHQTKWDKNGQPSKEQKTQATDRQFDSDGYLIRQYLTREDLLDGGTNVVQEMTYEYTK